MTTYAIMDRWRSTTNVIMIILCSGVDVDAHSVLIFFNLSERCVECCTVVVQVKGLNVYGSELNYFWWYRQYTVSNLISN